MISMLTDHGIDDRRMVATLGRLNTPFDAWVQCLWRWHPVAALDSSWTVVLHRYLISGWIISQWEGQRIQYIEGELTQGWGPLLRGVGRVNNRCWRWELGIMVDPRLKLIEGR